MAIENNEQAKTYLDQFRLPEGKTCRDCSNYHPWCRDVFAGEKKWPEDSKACAMGASADYFNVDFGKASEFSKERRRKR